MAASTDKYDRQLRLWGHHGQALLSQSKILVLGSTAVATETLKNLILPGICEFTIVDDAQVEMHDLGQNFFLERDDVGRPRAEATARLLKELNPDVKGSGINRSVASVLQDESFLNSFSVVIGCNITETQSRHLCNQVEKRPDGAALFIDSVGFLGKVRLYSQFHYVAETRRENEFTDLRLTSPPKGIDKLSLELELEGLSDVDHAHVPFVFLLTKALHHYRAGIDTALPKTAEQKNSFKNLLRSMRRNNDEVNFEDALKYAYLCFSEYTIPDGVKDILAKATPNTDFGRVCIAFREIVEKTGALPLSGRLPDFTSSTDYYLTLQKVYSDKAEQDVENVVQTLKRLFDPSLVPSLEFIRTMCKNAHYLEALWYRSIDEELDSPSIEDDDEEETMLSWYVGFRVVNCFRENEGRYPTDSEGDIQALRSIGEKLRKPYGERDGLDAVLQEFARYGGCEQHATSSFIGGVAAQEAVKIITHIFVPNNHTLLYNGLFGKTTVLSM